MNQRSEPQCPGNGPVIKKRRDDDVRDFIGINSSRKCYHAVVSRVLLNVKIKY